MSPRQPKREPRPREMHLGHFRAGLRWALEAPKRESERKQRALIGATLGKVNGLFG